MSIKVPSKKHQKFTRMLRLLESKSGSKYTNKEKEKLYSEWQKSYYKYLNNKYSFAKKIN